MSTRYEREQEAHDIDQYEIERSQGLHDDNHDCHLSPEDGCDCVKAHKDDEFPLCVECETEMTDGEHDEMGRDMMIKEIKEKSKVELDGEDLKKIALYHEGVFEMIYKTIIK